MSTAVVADAAEINREHQLARMSADSAVQHAMRCGNLLVAAKIEAKHGGWLPWLSANCPEISQRTAQCYMRLHQQLVDPANTQRVAGLSLRRAIDELTESRCAVVAIERGERDAAARGVLYAPVEMPDLGKLAVPDRPEPLHHEIGRAHV